MIEQAIYFALGCILTALLALLFAPAFWHRALRLTRQKLALQVPLSMQEILAERDQLRAEFAVERVRLEQDMARIQADKGRDMAEIGRRTLATVALTDEIADLRRLEAAQEREIARLLGESVERETENATLRVALHDAHGARDLWRRRAEAMRDEKERLQDEVESQRTTIASLKTRSMGLEMRLTDAERARVARERDVEAGLRSRLETAMGHVARHENASISLRRELDDAKTHIRQLEDDLAASRAALDALEERDQTARLQLGLQANRTAVTDPAMAERLDLISAENTALHGALSLARRDAATRAASVAAEPGDEELRESIHTLGLAVAQLSRQMRGLPELDDDKPRRFAKA